MTKITTMPIAKAAPSSVPAVITGPARGLEHGSPDDLILPSLLVMQPMSKLVTEKGHQTGTFVNSLSEEKYGTSVEFIPVIYSKYWNVLKKEGNKMVYDYRVTNRDDARLEGKRFFREGDLKKDVEEIMSFLGLVNGEPAVVKFKSSSIKGGKKLYTLATLSRKDLFATTYKLNAVKQTGEQGTYWTIDPEPIGSTGPELFASAEQIHKTFGQKVEATHGAEVEEVPY